MCGICGRVNLGSGKPVSPDALKAMTEALSHRGPDGEGFWIKGKVGLGHRRLAVIDLSERSRQPVGILEEAVVGVFNGEIYNFRELRQNLEMRGLKFDDRGEMEVILKAYQEFGVSFLDHLEGMFAVAIWDDRVQQLLLARDRLGKKPLFYRHDGDGIVFSSSLSGLFAEGSAERGNQGLHRGLGRVGSPSQKEDRPSCHQSFDAFSPPDLDPIALNHFLSLNYVPSPQSGLRSVAKLSPGHVAQFRPGHVEVNPYWQPVFNASRGYDSGQAKSRFFSLFDRAVEKRLSSDVPVGLFLSGGLDSAAVLASLAHLGARHVQTFTAGFADAAFDESATAERLAKWFGFTHSKILIQPPDLPSILNDLVRLSGEPVGDSSLLPTFLLARAAKERVSVILNGDGGDECFGGYHRHLASHWVERAGLSVFPTGFTRAVSACASGLCRLALSGTRSTWASRFERFFRNLCEPLEDQYVRWMVLLRGFEKEKLLGERFTSSPKADLADRFLKEKLGQYCHLPWLNRLSAVEWGTYLAEDLLVKMDRACMAHGLEPRSPFLDRDLVEFAMSLPASRKIRGLGKKVFLRDVMRQRLPDWVLRTPKKGFGVPIGSWLRTVWKSPFQDILSQSRLVQDGWLSRSVIANWTQEHLSKTRDHGYRLWNLLILETWYRQLVVK